MADFFEVRLSFAGMEFVEPTGDARGVACANDGKDM